MAHYTPHIDSDWCVCNSCQAKKLGEFVEGLPAFFQVLLAPGALAVGASLIGLALVFILAVLKFGWHFKPCEDDQTTYLFEKSTLIGASGLAWMIGVVILYFAYCAIVSIGELTYKVIRWIIS